MPTTDLFDQLEELNSAIDDLMDARKRIEAAVTAIAQSRAHLERRDIDWEGLDADHIWLNAFACIRPTDTFAADVGRAVIEKALAARGKSIPLTVNAS